jgi:hypothetical protein
MKISLPISQAKFFATAAIIMVAISFSLSSCAASHQSCDAYQNIEVEAE